ncbi:MAG TPA: hypothetical protein PK514_14180 [Spirochaetota bacterium]|nr:hypothetical protein [Spirochaetota bacterium]
MAGTGETVAGTSQTVAGTSETVAGTSETAAGTNETAAGTGVLYTATLPGSEPSLFTCANKTKSSPRSGINLCPSV